jgi:hypothetical protein
VTYSFAQIRADPRRETMAVPGQIKTELAEVIFMG